MVPIVTRMGKSLAIHSKLQIFTESHGQSTRMLRPLLLVHRPFSWLTPLPPSPFSNTLYRFLSRVFRIDDSGQLTEKWMAIETAKKNLDPWKLCYLFEPVVLPDRIPLDPGRTCRTDLLPLAHCHCLTQRIPSW